MKKLLFLLFILLSYSGAAQEKVTIANVDKAFALIFSDPKQAKLDLDGLEIQSKKQNDSLYGIVLNNKGIYYAVQTQMDSALIYFNKSLALVNTTSKRAVGTQTNIAIIYKKKGEIDKAVNLLLVNLDVANQKNYNAARATIYGELASCYATKEWYKQSLAHLLQSIEFWGNENPIPTKKIAIEKQKLVNLYLKMANLPKALKIATEIALVFKEAGDLHNFYLVQITISNIYLEQNKPKKALVLIKHTLPGLQELNDKELLFYAFDGEAHCIENSGNKNLALQKYCAVIAYGLRYEQIKTVQTIAQAGNLMLQLKDSSGLQKLKIQTETRPFKKLLLLSNAEDQLQYYLWSEKYAKLVNDKQTQINSKGKSEHLAFLLKEKENYHFAKELQVALDSTSSKITERNVSQMPLVPTKNSLITGILVLCGLVMGYAFYSRWEKKQIPSKKPKQKINVENKPLKEVDEVQQIVFDALKINIKPQEIELFAQTITALKMKLSPQNTTNKNNIPLPQKQELDSVDLENEIKTLIIQFHSINPEFSTALQKTYPVLSRNDLYFCSLIKLNFSNKEIAQLTNISTESVITKKYRMAKKLQLDKKEVNFYQWLSKMP